VNKKREYVVAINALMAEGASHQQACSMVGLPHNYYPRFKKVINKLDNLEQDASFVPFKRNGTARKIIRVAQVFCKPFRKTCLALFLKSGNAGYKLVPV
jgi:hypothetical protein